MRRRDRRRRTGAGLIAWCAEPRLSRSFPRDNPACAPVHPCRGRRTCAQSNLPRSSRQDRKRDLVGATLRLLRIVPDDNDGEIALRVDDEGFDLLTADRVERAGRFIEQDHLGDATGLREGAVTRGVRGASISPMVLFHSVTLSSFLRPRFRPHHRRRKILKDRSEKTQAPGDAAPPGFYAINP